jgi:glycerol-3-phosphate acyltransferase PlsX
VEVPAVRGPVVLLDAGANVDCSPDLLAQFALAGSAYAQIRLQRPSPRVGLLSIGSEPGKGDALRKAAYASLAGLPIEFVGNVESEAVAVGGYADVVVTDGFAGNVLLKGLEATLALARATVAAALPDAPAAVDALDTLVSGRAGGAVLLGVDGVVVVGHGASGPREVAACVTLAADIARERLVPRVAEAIGGLVGIRRSAAGLGTTRGVPG